MPGFVKTIDHARMEARVGLTGLATTRVSAHVALLGRTVKLSRVPTTFVLMAAPVW